MTVTDKMDEDYKKIAQQVTQLRQITRPAAESPAHAQAHSTKQPGSENAHGTDCIFCKIAKHELSAMMIEEDSTFIAFLDIQPKAVGHVIVISKRHFAGIGEMNTAESSTLIDVINSISKRMKNNLKATGTCIVSANGISAGQIVPHFAIHIIHTYTHTVDIPILNVIQPQKVPDFVMSDAERLLKKLDR